MRVKSFASRHVRLSLTDFGDDPHDLVANLPASDIRVRRKGNLSARTGRPAAKSTILVLYGFDGSVAWDDAFAGLAESVGGMTSLKKFLLRVSPADQHIHFQIPARGSAYQDNNYLSRTTLDAFQDLRLWVGFDFSDYDPSDPTHLDCREITERDDKSVA